MELYGVTFNENSISEVLDIVSKHKACVKEDVFKKYFPKLYNELMSKSYPESFIFAQKLFHFLYEDTDLKTVYKDGKLINKMTFQEVRANLYPEDF